MGLDPIALGLPHRAPFIFVDEVLELEPGQRAVCCRTFPPGEAFFRGHFPGDPLVPGVILTEALAQTAGLAAGQAGRGFRLSAIKTMKFPKAARPGDEVRLEAQKTGAMQGLWQFAVLAQVGGQTVAEGAVVLAETAAPGAGGAAGSEP